MNCPYCGTKIVNGDNFCTGCGCSVDMMVQQQEVYDSPSDSGHGKKVKRIFLTVFIALIGIAIGFCGATFLPDLIDKDETTVNEYEGEKEDEYEADDEGTSATMEENTTSEVTETTAYDPGKLYRPDSDMFCAEYTRYISGYWEGQGYAKMRFGPDKSKYNIVGQIDNGEIVKVQTKSVNGWTLVYYDGNEGWVRTDFLFETYNECFGNVVFPDINYDGYSGYVDVTGVYDGQNLNMRSGPAKEYLFITKVPDGAKVTILGKTNNTDEWIYISYNGNNGWVLSEYVFID